MIDLRFPGLPSQLECGGNFYEIKTSFRTWIHFDYILRTKKIAWDGIFIGGVPECEWISAALEFLKSENATPRTQENKDSRLIDYILDGDYIVAAFQQAYGIDLTKEDMHWHRFKALLVSLPEQTLMSKIISYRGWIKKKYDHDADMRKLRQEWTLPDVDEKEKKEALLEWANSVLL